MSVWSYDGSGGSGVGVRMTWLPGGNVRVDEVREMGLEEARQLGAIMERPE